MHVWEKNELEKKAYSLLYRYGKLLNKKNNRKKRCLFHKQIKEFSKNLLEHE
jgi:hypothetical protein